MKNLSDHINQSGITYGDKKLELMREACRIQAVPLTDENTDENGATKQPTFFVKLFDPCGSWTWYIQDWDGSDVCFGYVEGFDKEWGSFSLSELSEIKGNLGIGIEIDTYFSPTPTETILKQVD